MAIAEYMGVEKINGPFLLLSAVPGIGYDEIADILSPDGTVRK